MLLPYLPGRRIFTGRGRGFRYPGEDGYVFFGIVPMFGIGWYWLLLLLLFSFCIFYFWYMRSTYSYHIDVWFMVFGIYIIFEYEIGISSKICQPSCILEDFPPYDFLPNHSIPWYQLLASGVCTAAVSFSKCLPFDYKKNGCWRKNLMKPFITQKKT